MDRIAQLRRVLTDPDASPLPGAEPVDRLLLHLIVHLASADGEVDEAEFAVLGRLLPGSSLGEVMETVIELTNTQLEVGRLEVEVPSPTDRRRLLALAEEFVRMDGVLSAGEERMLAALKQEIG